MNSIVVTSTKQNIKFGYEGEDNVTKIIFPYDESWLEYGEGNFEVRILRCGDEVAYTATEVVDDRQAMTLTMTVTDIELSVRGRGEMQLCYVCPDSIKKSPIYQYTVNRSIDYKYAVDPPDGSIIASVEKSLSEIKNTTNRLSNSVISIENSINDVNSQINNINNKISEFDDEIDSIGEVETRVDNLKTSIQSINGRINTAEGNINENTESISDLNESVTELENRKVTDLETSGGKSDSGKYLTVGTDGKIKATSLTIPPTITVDTSLSATSQNPVQNKVIKTELNNINSNIETCNTEISKINGSLDEYVMSRIGDYISPNIINGDETMTAGYISKNGAVHSSTTMKYSDYLPVQEGEFLRGYTHQSGVFGFKSFRFLCAYNASKNAISSAGSDSSIQGYTVPAGVAFVRVSFDQAGIGSHYMVSVNCIPTEYSEYTDPQRAVADNFLTPESESFLSNLMTNGVSTTDLEYKHGCAYPRGVPLLQTVGLPETWYFKSALTPYTNYQYVSAGTSYTVRYNDKTVFPNNVAVNSANGFKWAVFDMFINRLDRENGENGVGRQKRIIDENLSDCSLLAIGDSTVDHDTMTATLLSHFTEQGHTITLLGTLGDGSETNHNEGRAGWKASDYFTDRQYKGVTNPFYNPTTQTFDFSYYMQNQGYAGVDFVVIQLGINDLYNDASTANIIPTTWDYIKRMVQSVLAYDSNIKIILNLPTTPNSDQTAHSNILFLYQNTVIRYNEYAQAHALSEFGRNTVRTSYCHLILDPDTEIRDNVHPTVEGYQKMALELVNQINCWQNGY